jgi:hypothetical protein
MEYFLVETDKKNRIPYGINVNRAVDIRYANRNMAYKIPNCCVVDMKTPMEVFFPDILIDSFLMVSEEAAQVIEMYEPETIFKTIYLLETESEIHATYFMPFVEEVECLSEQTKRSRGGTELYEIVLREEAVAGKTVFRIAGFTHPYLIVRLDVLESMLRRGVCGIRLKELVTV